MKTYSWVVIELIRQGILTSFLAVNHTVEALALLKESQFIFSDPVEGTELHAEVLFCAIKSTNREVLQFLLSIPVLSDINFFKFCGHTPISLAVEEGKEDLIPLLLTKTDKNFALHMAVKLKQEKTKHLLLSRFVYKDKLLKLLGIR